MLDLRKKVPDHFRSNLEWPRTEYILFYVKCLGDTSEKQKECRFYENSSDEDFCLHSFDNEGVTDRCYLHKSKKEVEDARI